jgi:hypothetical protein
MLYMNFDLVNQIIVNVLIIQTLSLLLEHHGRFLAPQNIGQPPRRGGVS